MFLILLDIQEGKVQTSSFPQNTMREQLGSLRLVVVSNREPLLALELTEGKKKEAADLLGIDRKTLYRKLEEYGGAE